MELTLTLEHIFRYEEKDGILEYTRFSQKDYEEDVLLSDFLQDEGYVILYESVKNFKNLKEVKYDGNFYYVSFDIELSEDSEDDFLDKTDPYILKFQPDAEWITQINEKYISDLEILFSPVKISVKLNKYTLDISNYYQDFFFDSWNNKT